MNIEAHKTLSTMSNANFKTPDDISNAIHSLISFYPGKYAGMAKHLDPVNGTDNALRNRVRQINGQLVPLGMILEMEAEANSNVITESIAKHQGCVLVKLPSVDHVDNSDLLKEFNELFAEIGEFCRKHNQYVADNVLDRAERKALKHAGYNIQAKISRLIALSIVIFGDGK